MKIAFIGMGNMASALVGGFLSAGKLSPADVSAFDPNTAGLAEKAAKYGFAATKSAKLFLNISVELPFVIYSW